MPRNGSGQYSRPAGTTAISGATIESAKYNELAADLANDLNVPRPVVAGGTGAATAAAARANLGIAIGTDIQGYDAGLASIAGLTVAADQGIYATGEDTYATFALGSLSRTFLANTTAAGFRSTLGVAEVIDEDDFATNSATRPPSQQSTKAFIDAYGAKILSSNGSANLPGGLILKWGSTEVSPEGDKAISWASSFPNNVLQAIACAGSSFNVTNDAGVGIHSLTRFGATVRSGIGGSSTVRYFAIGY